MRDLVLDTSVWIEYFRANPAYFDTCQKLILPSLKQKIFPQ